MYHQQKRSNTAMNRFGEIKLGIVTVRVDFDCICNTRELAQHSVYSVLSFLISNFLVSVQLMPARLLPEPGRTDTLDISGADR